MSSPPSPSSLHELPIDYKCTKHKSECFITFLNTESENTKLNGVFLTNFELSENVVKHRLYPDTYPNIFSESGKK